MKFNSTNLVEHLSNSQLKDTLTQDQLEAIVIEVFRFQAQLDTASWIAEQEMIIQGDIEHQAWREDLAMAI